jgi:DNA polymerase-3 subunit gamma/tau
METLQNALGAMRVSADPKTTAELCLVSLCDNTLGESVGELRARISRLEEQLRSGAFRASAPVREAEEELPPPPEDEYPEPAAPEEEPWESEPEEEPEPEPDPEPVPDPVPPPAQELSREKLYELLAAMLPRELATRLDDDRSIRASLENNMLKLEVVPGFLFGRVNRPELLTRIGDAASKLAGREIRAAVSELTEASAAPRRSLDELKGFKEVHFI